jgi:hypothetical protein
LTFNGLDSVTSQKIGLFILIAVRTSNSTIIIIVLESLSLKLVSQIQRLTTSTDMVKIHYKDVTFMGENGSYKNKCILLILYLLMNSS